MALTTEYLMSLSPLQQQKAILLERVRCYADRRYLIETYFTVDAGGTRKPFKLFPHQVKALKAYIKYQNNITMKSRQMGFTTFTSAYVGTELVNKANFKTLIISKEMGSAKDFLKNVKEILNRARDMTRISTAENAPSWLIPEYKEGYNNKESFELENGSYVKAQGNTDDAGRGISGLNLAIVDEVAFIDRSSPNRMHEIWAAIGPALSTVKGKTILISTPYGSNSFYYETYTNAKEMGFNRIESHWTEHPLFNQGTYQWIPDETIKGGGKIKFYGDIWPDELFDKETNVYKKIPKDSYPFILDGNIRSPWYDAESKKLGPTKTACELDCSFVGTGGEVLTSTILREIKQYSESMQFKRPYTEGHFKAFKLFKEFIPGHNYVLTADVMTGDGSDWSTIVVMDMDALEICATMKLQIQPNFFAKIIFQVGSMFGFPPAVVENQGGGASTLQELKEIRYPNIYYSTLNKKDETQGTRKRKIGLWVSDDVRTKGGDKVEQLVSSKEVNIPCVDLVVEFYNWIWDKDGKRRHAPGKHDDLIMALQHALYYITYVYKRNKRNREAFKKSFATDGLNQFGSNGFITENQASFNPFKNKKNNGLVVDEDKTGDLPRRTIFL